MKSDIKSYITLVGQRSKVDSEINETPLLSALQSRCCAGLRSLCHHGARMSADVLDELKTISSSKA